MMDWELIVYLLVAGFALLPLLVRLPAASLAVKLSTVVVVIISLDILSSEPVSRVVTVQTHQNIRIL